ncbi:cilia- and flagella-associated protein 299-like [Episyrphus balteatus]|uniref:cilia- and flagella-associated protein 299-like n=1 Tax=Episyrphus balteatus TaxID=286459 RepID=UPI0024854EAE|nr:cilia- and flagella-associated protein 299-like [Episyrphus balteatus]
MNAIQDVFLLDCDTYEDYLDIYITRNDLRFLRNIRFSRMLVELGYRSTTEIYTPEQFNIRKAAAYEAMFPIKKSLILFHDGIQITDPVLHELAEREKSNYQKILSTIIFLRHRQKSGFEISGYIDFENSLRKSNLKTDDSTDWKAVFMMRSLLRPKPTDLSFHNSRTNTTFNNESDNYAIINDHDHGLIFMHKGDRKKIFVNQDKGSGHANATRTMVFSPKYGHVILYDHIIRKKA